MSRKTYLFSTGIHIIHMIDTKKFYLPHYANKYFLRHTIQKRGQPRLTGGPPRLKEGSHGLRKKYAPRLTAE